jgi:hypothetical protein
LPSMADPFTPQKFIAKWRNVELSERAASQEHFLDLPGDTLSPPCGGVD